MKKLKLISAILLFLTLQASYSQSYDFDLLDLDGNSVKLSELLKEGPVFVQFWALWCLPCKEEMKQLNELYGIYKDSGFVYVAVNQDDPKSSTKVKSYIESKNYIMPVLMDENKIVFEQFGGQNLPYSLFIDQKGNVFKTYTGYISGDEEKLKNDIIQALKESKSGK